MKIAFIFSRIRISPGDGIISQAYTWKRILENRGHAVDLISCWDYNDLTSYDIIQIFSCHNSQVDEIRTIRMKNNNIVIAPILDPKDSIHYYKICSKMGFLLRQYSIWYNLFRIKKDIKACLVRSSFEKEYMEKGFGYDPAKCYLVPLSVGIPFPSYNSEREDFCLHISRISDPFKNVKRIIDASVKYKFRLCIAGMLRDEKSQKEFHKWIKGKENINYLGYVSDEEKIKLCSKAKVFALPSFVEGVGLSALEAAVCGCDIVITNIGGPKEYYHSNEDLAIAVNPSSVDEIGIAIRKFLDGKTYQPKLKNYLEENNSDEKIGEILEKVYTNVLNNN